MWMLQWLRMPKVEVVCPWNVYTYLTAARGSHLQLLPWLRSVEDQDQCPRYETWCRAVTTSMEIREWLRSADAPVPCYSDVSVK
jgi:hypothetical protein